MRLFEYLRRKKLDNIVENVKKRNAPKRYLMLILGCFILAFSFNVFFLEYDIMI